MDLPELPKRLFTLGEEPKLVKSILYHTDDTKLYSSIRAALHPDEYQELRDSKLGVFLKFKELNFAWASRLVHFMLYFKLHIKKKYELWCLVGPEPVRFSLIEVEHLTCLNCDYVENLENPKCEVTEETTAFWQLLGVGINAGLTTEHIIATCKRCAEWSRDDRMRLGYLAIFTRFIEERKISTDHDAEDKAADNIVKVMWNENHHWTMECWEVAGTTLWSNQNSVVVYAKNEEGYVKEEPTVMEERPRKKSRKEAEESSQEAEESSREVEESPREAEAAPVGLITQEVFEKGIKQMVDVMRDGFGMILREIKFVADRVEVVADRVKVVVESTKGTASNEAPHIPSEPPKRMDEFRTTYQTTYSRRLPGSHLVTRLISQFMGSLLVSCLSESVNEEKGDPSVSKEDTETKEAEEVIGIKEAEVTKAAKEAKTAKEAKAAKAAKETKALKETKEAREAK
ncbi:hypothetical protein N665_1736s0002 [Sinapis alba]|nr:hypothetical protein N665_1736s0002 [Sinapis alba]